MTLEEILKSQNLTEDQIKKITGEMKQNKIYTAGEENLDVRYGKLKTDHEALTAKQAESDKLISELQKASKDHEAIQAKIAEYEKAIAEKDEELKQAKIEAAIKVALLDAKAVDVDYMTFKLKEKGDITLDEKGNIKGIDDMLVGLKTQFPKQFETTAGKKVEEKKLPEVEEKKAEEPKDLADALRMSYEEGKEG